MCDIERMIECGICLEILDDTNKMLPCQHTFHSVCLENLHRNEGSINCPICRTNVADPIDQLKKNIFLSGLVDEYMKNPPAAAAAGSEDADLAQAITISREEFMKGSAADLLKQNEELQMQLALENSKREALLESMKKKTGDYEELVSGKDESSRKERSSVISEKENLRCEIARLKSMFESKNALASGSTPGISSLLERLTTLVDHDGGKSAQKPFQAVRGTMEGNQSDSANQDLLMSKENSDTSENTNTDINDLMKNLKELNTMLQQENQSMHEKQSGNYLNHPANFIPPFIPGPFNPQMYAPPPPFYGLPPPPPFPAYAGKEPYTTPYYWPHPAYPATFPYPDKNAAVNVLPSRGENPNALRCRGSRGKGSKFNQFSNAKTEPTNIRYERSTERRKAPPKDRHHYDTKAEEIMQPNWDEAVESFEEMNLKQELLRGIRAYGFEKPFAIQQRAIVPCVTGRDVIAQAPIGSGKTSMYSISILQKIDPSLNECQALILASTRERAQQTQKVILALSDFMENVKCHASIGGTDPREDKRRLEEGVQVVVGTSGRLYDMITHKSLKMDHIKVIVLDEADQLLSNVLELFKEKIHKVFQHLPEDAQVIFLSAVIRQDVLDFSKQYMRDPVQIVVKQESTLAEGVKQFYLFVEKDEYKIDTLCDLCDADKHAVIFCNTRQKVDWLRDMMTKNGRSASSLHAETDREKRESILKNFKTGSIRLLITTDLLPLMARRSVQQVSLVINYDLPKPERYIQRIQCCCNFGRKGVAVNFVTTENKRTLSDIEQLYNTQIPEMPKTIDDLL